MVSSRQMLVEGKPMPQLAMKLLESCSTISVAKLSETLTV